VKGPLPRGLNATGPALRPHRHRGAVIGGGAVDSAGMSSWAGRSGRWRSPDHLGAAEGGDPTAPAAGGEVPVIADRELIRAAKGQGLEPLGVW